MVEIKSVIVNSPAFKAGIKGNDKLITINNNEINYVLDYHFYASDENLTLLLNDNKKIKIKKEEYEDLGLEFETYLIDKQRACKNKCIFCFIDQLPKGMRESLYFKDDDSRLSFLFGNYITLTNITDKEVERIIKMHISPINISVHTTDKELRCKIMNNRFAGNSLKYIKKLNDAGIKINCQLVLMPGINDGNHLKSTIDDLLKYENVQCIAAVSVGLTKFRDGLYPLRPYTKDEAKSVIDIIENKNNNNKRVFASDEFYLKAELPIPCEDFYGDFHQLENGVGMYSLFAAETMRALETTQQKPKIKKSCATGVAAFPLISNIVDKAKLKWHNLNCKVYKIENNFFGENITVAGLLTGKDIIEQLKDKDLGDLLLLPSNMLRHEKDMFLDNVTVEELEKALNVKVEFISDDGYEFIDALAL